MTSRSLLLTLLVLGLAVVAEGRLPAAGQAQRIIKGFEVDRYGEPLFFPNSDDWRKRFGGAS